MRTLAISMFATASCVAATPTKTEHPTPAPVQPNAVPISIGLPNTEDLFPANAFVDGTINGQNVKILLDTGAGVPILAKWVARELELPTQTVGGNGKVLDAQGAPLQVELARHVTVDLTGWGPIVETPLFVAELPPEFEQGRVGMLVGPQHIAVDGRVVVLDLRAGELRAEPSEGAFERAKDTKGLVLSRPWVRGCSSATNRFANIEFEVPMRFNGHEAILTIDTGALSTHVSEDSEAGKALKALSTQTTPSSGVASSSPAVHVPDVMVEVGDLSRTLDVRVNQTGGTSVCPSDGLLGMDVLVNCTLTMTRTQLVAYCDPPAEAETNASAPSAS